MAYRAIGIMTFSGRSECGIIGAMLSCRRLRLVGISAMREGYHASISPRVVLSSAALVFVATLLCSPVSAQPINCGELYKRVMALYQTAPQSAEYNQVSSMYNGSCRPGAGAANTIAPGAASALPETSLPMRGAPTNTVPTESRSVVRGGSAGHK